MAPAKEKRCILYTYSMAEASEFVEHLKGMRGGHPDIAMNKWTAEGLCFI
jgi:hypothetical protein